jgi:hypothetical protein
VRIENPYLLESREVGGIEGQDSVDLIDVHQGDDAGVVRVLSGYPISRHQTLPGWENEIAFRQDSKAIPERVKFRNHPFDTHSKTIHLLGSRSHHPEFDQVLNGNVQFLSVTAEDGERALSQ